MNLTKKILSIILLLSVVSLTFERKKDNFETQSKIEIPNIAVDFEEDIGYCLEVNAKATDSLFAIKGFTDQGLSYEKFAESYDTQIGSNFALEFLDDGENLFFYLDEGNFEVNWHSFKLTCKYIMYEKDDSECREVNKILKKGYESITGDKEKNITFAQWKELNEDDFSNTMGEVFTYLKDRKDLQIEFLFNWFDVDNNKFISRDEIGFDCEKDKEQTCNRGKASYDSFSKYLKEDFGVESITYDLGKKNIKKIGDSFITIMMSGPKDLFNGFDDDKNGFIDRKEFLMDCQTNFAFDNEINTKVCDIFSSLVNSTFTILSENTLSKGFNGNQLSDEKFDKILDKMVSSKFNIEDENLKNFLFFYFDDDGNNILDKSDLEYKCQKTAPKAILNAGIKQMKNGFH